MIKDLAWEYPHIADTEDGKKQFKKAEKFCEDYNNR